MLNIYVAVHRAPVQGAPEPVTTYITPTPATAWDEVQRAVAPLDPAPVTNVRSYQLTYPEMPTDPGVALAYVAETYRDCGRCHLSEQRGRVVHFRGNPYARVLCLGEGPGRTEDERGLPFVGAAGRYADEFMREVGIDPNDFAWANLVGCRPCENRFTQDRPPTLVEKVACSEHLTMILRAVRPRVVVCFGKEPTSAFFEEPPPVNSWTMIPGPPEEPRDWVAVAHLRHPSYLLRLGVAQNAYHEYFGAKLFMRALAAWAPTLEKVSRWSVTPLYIRNLQPIAGKPEAKR